MDDKENFMAEFWKAFGWRLAQVVPAKKVNEFEYQHDLVGFRLDRVIQGKKGVNIETLVRICNTLDLSPTWLLFGKGRRDLSTILEQMPELDEHREKRYAQQFEVLSSKQKKEVMSFIKELQQQHDQTQLHRDNETPPPREPRGRGAKN